MTNSLLGVLIYFRKEVIEIVIIQQMFYYFLVRQDHHSYMQFLWGSDEQHNKQMIEFHMKAYFGEMDCRPQSPTMDCIILHNWTKHSHEAIQFVERDFYVDDGLKSMPILAEAIDLLKKTQ